MTNKCDSCNNKAAYTVSGYYMAHYLCGPCAGSLCLAQGDTAGAAKFIGQ
jgi:hypothetical protein